MPSGTIAACLSPWRRQRSANGAGKYELVSQEAWQPEDWSDRLQARFPSAFKLHWGLECGSGWADLIAATLSIYEAADEPVWFSQIKEKYGELRMYGTGALGDLEDLEDHAEILSRHICEDCGAPGRTRSYRGWFRTQCNKHADEPRK